VKASAFFKSSGTSRSLVTLSKVINNHIAVLTSIFEALNAITASVVTETEFFMTPGTAGVVPTQRFAAEYGFNLNNYWFDIISMGLIGIGFRIVAGKLILSSVKLTVLFIQVLFKDWFYGTRWIENLEHA